MNYPLISEYVEAIRMAEDSFDQLCHLRPVLDDSGQPVMSSGNFAVVFKMQDTQSGKLHAVRCFHREQAGRTESYRQIEEALQQVSSPYLVTFRYLDRELFVDSRQTGGETEFPVLLMDWVEGVTLDRYLREHIGDCDTLAVLAYRFSLMAAWLLQQTFAHGDLKPDNILVRTDGSLTLVDYDGMFVPAMQGQASRELGSPDFRHPLRSRQDFDASIDDFPLVSILLSLKAISLNPSLLDKHGASDRLLFSEADYHLLGHCRVLQEIFPSSDNELNTLVSLFTLALTQGKLTGIAPSLLALAEPKCLVEELSTKVTDKDLEEAVEDEYGVKYSKDGKRLLNGRIINERKYAIRKGTKVICNRAFDYCWGLTHVHIPDSVTTIGKEAFSGCSGLTHIDISDSVTTIGEEAFSYCCRLTHIDIPDSVTTIGKKAFCECLGLTHIDIPDSVTIIGKEAFWNCCDLTRITVSPDNPYYDSREDCNAIIFTKEEVTLIRGCKNTHIPDSVTTIGEKAFSHCSGLTHINIPSSVTTIGKEAFSSCDGLPDIHIPDSVTTIGEKAFWGCRGLTHINIPDSVTTIGKEAFSHCSGLTHITVSPDNPYYDSREGCNAIICTKGREITLIRGCEHTRIPDSVTRIGERAFSWCYGLTHIDIPDSVTTIGKGAFLECSSLTHIDIPDSVTRIGDSAFQGCRGLTHIHIPDSVTTIGEFAFCECLGLTHIDIPDSVTTIGKEAFSYCRRLTHIHIPKGTKEKFARLLPYDKDRLVEV